MFAIFDNGEFVSFWGNNKGDVFFQITCAKKGLGSPSLFWYEVDQRPEYFEFNNNKDLVVKNRIVELVGEEEVVSFETVATIPKDVYFDNGIFYKVC